MSAQGATGERPIADGFQFRALPKIDRDGDDLGAILGLQPWDRQRGLESAAVSKDDTLHALEAGVGAEALGQGCRAAAVLGNHQNGVVASNGAHHLR